MGPTSVYVKPAQAQNRSRVRVAGTVAAARATMIGVRLMAAAPKPLSSPSETISLRVGNYLPPGPVLVNSIYLDIKATARRGAGVDAVTVDGRRECARCRDRGVRTRATQELRLV